MSDRVGRPRGPKVDCDYCVIGAGIIGLATALELIERSPGARVVVLEKELGAARHQTGHNSGVIHAGVYYQPGSLKARLCREGEKATKDFCRKNNIRFEVCGKLLVATDDNELTRMQQLAVRARENEIAFDTLDAAQLRQEEPAISGAGALKVHATGIVNYARICDAMALRIAEGGGALHFGTTVDAIIEDETGVTVRWSNERLRATRVVVCAGLQSDRLARLAGLAIKHRIIPFRGEYYRLSPNRSDLVRHLIYPIPDPELPFLGIHLTRMIDGSVTVGPNAVLGFAREGYPKGSFEFPDIGDMLMFGGFWRVISQNWRSGINEFASSLSRQRYLRECRKYCPSLTLDNLETALAGIRAQAVLEDGTLVHDFLFVSSERMLHVCNAPSPAATSALPIAEMIVDRLFQQQEAGIATATALS